MRALGGWRGTVLGAAALITILTIVSRMAGFGRNLALARSVGATCLNSVYTTVNTVPNIMFEIVAGGALAALVVPLLARAIAARDHEHVQRTASALLTWTVLILVPVALVVALAAEPITRALLADSGECDQRAIEVGTSMLRVFAPQIVLYGIGIVLTGILQTHRRFGGPAVAPLASSLVVIAAYVTFALVAPSGTDIATLSTGQELILSIGTTLGVVMLTFSLLVPFRRIGLKLRPTLGFPVGVAPRVRAMAMAGVAALAAQQLSIAAVLFLGNSASATTVAVYTQAQTLFLLPWAVFAVPVAVAVFPTLAERWDAGDRQAFRGQLAASTRVVVALCLGAAAVLVASSDPFAQIVFMGAPGVDSVDAMARGVVGLAPGLLGFGLFALLPRALYAARTIAVTTVASVVGWLAVVAAAIAFSASFPTEDRVLALALGNSVGLTVLGVGLIAVVVRRTGAESMSGVARVAAAGVVAAAIAALVGHWASELVTSGTVAGAIPHALGSGLVAAVVFGAVIVILAREPLLDGVRTLRRSSREAEREPDPDATPGSIRDHFGDE